MAEEIKINVLRPFGPSIAKITMPTELVDNLNKHVDETILDIKKLEELDYGSKLAGNVKQEFKLEKDFIEKSGLLKFLAFGTSNWIKLSDQKEIKKFEIQESWVVRQFKNEYNPIHYHGGHISGVGYLKTPKNFGEYQQSSKRTNRNGQIALVHGNRMFNSKATINFNPIVGDFYLFPNYLMHTVYPFSGNDDERRSISFNAEIDDEIYNVYSSKE
jgi:uncharacterized protein (TIGR02466 family)